MKVQVIKLTDGTIEINFTDIEFGEYRDIKLVGLPKLRLRYGHLKSQDELMNAIKSDENVKPKRALRLGDQMRIVLGEKDAEG